jgi:hypothetical protein
MSTDNPEISQAERRRVLRNDARVREGATFRDFADSGVGNEGRESGRFKKLDTTPVIHPLPPNSPWSAEQPQPGDEAPTGYAINQVERDR